MNTALNKSIHNDFKKMCENNYKFQRQNYINSKECMNLSKDNNKSVRIMYLNAKIYIPLLQHDKVKYKKYYKEIKQLCYDIIEEDGNKPLVNFIDKTIKHGDDGYLSACNHFKILYDENEKLNDCVNRIPNWF